jgi:hypothetical protein
VKNFLTLTTMGIVSSIAVSIAIGASVLSSKQAKATPTFGQQTGLPCTQCHVNSTGVGGLTAFGDQFKANGNKLPGK